MKLMLFTPVIRSSAIGRMASLISQKLISSGYEIIVIRTENERVFKQPVHNFGTELIPWCDFTQVDLLSRSADAIIYQIGDNYGFHQGCFPWLAQLSGTVCLHDFFLGNFFYGWARSHPELADGVLRTWYGAEAANRFFSYKNIESFIEGTREISPMTEWICSMAQGVITHSHLGIERILRSCPGPVRVVPLAYDAPYAKLAKTSTAKKDKLHILTIGHVNKNKRAESVIQAIGQSQLLRKKATYQLVGNITKENRAKLIALAKKQRVKLIISGEVEDAVLAKAIDKADVIACLRWPALETCSASTIEALLYAKPTMVTNTGFYSEIPDSCTIKINPDNEINEIMDALEKLQEDPEYLHALGQQGQQWARETFTPDNYTLKLIEVILSTTRTQVITGAIDYFSKLLYNWGARGDILGKEYILKPLSIFEEVS